MKPEDLRIGNYVFDELGISVIVSSIASFPEFEIYNEMGDYVNDPTPIPLTEGRLLKLGAKKENGIIIHDRFRLKYFKMYDYWYVTDLDKAYITKVEFVHEWQNVFAVLNGTELTIKK